MKKYKIVFILALIFIAQIANAQFKIRAYGTVGYSTGNAYVGDGNALSYSGGIQGFYHINRYISIGVDIAYLHAYTAKYNSPNPSQTKPGNANYLSALVVAEGSIAKNLIVLQLGAGYYFDIANYDGHRPGLMVGYGLDIPITLDLSIPIMGRADFIIAPEGAIPLSMSIGITYRFGSLYKNW